MWRGSGLLTARGDDFAAGLGEGLGNGLATTLAAGFGGGALGGGVALGGGALDLAVDALAARYLEGGGGEGCLLGDGEAAACRLDVD